MYRISITNTVTGETENIEADAFFAGVHKTEGGAEALGDANCPTLDAAMACVAALDSVKKFLVTNRVPWAVIAEIGDALEKMKEEQG